MKKLLFILTMLLSVKCFAQTQELDSLKTLLQRERSDTSKVLLLTEISFRLFESNPDTAMQLALDALDISQRIGFKKGEARSYRRLGNIYYVAGNFSKSLELQLKALKISEEINDIEGMAGANGNIGLVYVAQEDYQKSLTYYFKGNALHRQINNKVGETISTLNIGVNYLGQKKYDSAALFAQQAYNLAVQINYKRTIGGSLARLGEIHYESGRYSLAMEYLRLSFVPLIESENLISLGDAYLTMAQVFEKQQKHDSVIHYGTLAKVIAQKRGFVKELRDAARFLSHYYRKYNADSAFFYQDISKACNDTLFSQQKQHQINNLVFDEKLRQQELHAAELKAKEERKHNLQYAAIALGVITFIIVFFLLSHSIIANQKLIRFLGVIALLIVFEFLNLLLHPWLGAVTHHSPVLMLLAMVFVAALLIPLHHKLEHWITHRLVEKNKKIRLSAAKKTIATLEKEMVNP